MMNYVKDGNTRAAATNYIYRVLEQGHTLTKSLLENINLQEGAIVILLPGALEPARIVEFDSGHFPQEQVTTIIGGQQETISAVADSDAS